MKTMFHVGFTGTRKEPTDAQAEAFGRYLSTIVNTFSGGVILHHGSCVGADHMAHRRAQFLGAVIHIHPPTNTYLKADLKGDVEHPPKEYLERNRDIVDHSDILIGCPEGPEVRRSGTWSTIRYARRKLKWLVVIDSNGYMVEEN